MGERKCAVIFLDKLGVRRAVVSQEKHPRITCDKVPHLTMIKMSQQDHKIRFIKSSVQLIFF